MRATLAKGLRNQLEKAVEKARDIAELAAREELQRLAVGEKATAEYLTQEQRDLRNRLRAHARALGDFRKTDGEQGVTELVTEIAYEHWHRMLFSRFLAENDLLMYEDGVTALAINDCFNLAEEETGDSSNGWRYASNYAAKMLPQIFRNNSPVFEIEFAPNHLKKLEQLLEDLDEAVFHSQDALGWVYQFWQSKRKAEVNASEVKIGAKELSPVTQLFTEPYMVSFLLDNALGAWWANKQLSATDYENANTEAELRDKAAIDSVPLTYLRFIKTYTTEQKILLDSDDAPDEKLEPEGSWEPAAGKFEQWPDHLSELTTLDPCCGSGHFLVAVFLMLVPMRMRLEGLTEPEAINAVLKDNIHGLELDQRCIEIAVFALALEAWRYPNSGGYRQLPEIHLACSGLCVKAAKDEWRQLGLGKKNLSIALDWMHKEFSDAPVLGSLINPANSTAAKLVSWDELSETLSKALEQESGKEHHGESEQKNLEAAVVAQGMAKAATMLAGKYQWVVTNVPYLKRGNQDDTLKGFIEKHYPAGKNDLATAFLDRCLEFCVEGGGTSVVLPQNWLFLTSYSRFRERLLARDTWNLIARMGSGAFDTISGEVVKAILICLTRGNLQADYQGLFVSDGSRHCLRGLDVSEGKSAGDKAKQLLRCEIKSVGQADQLGHPDARITVEEVSELELMTQYASSFQGITTGDNPRFIFCFWETNSIIDEWSTFQSTGDIPVHYSGRHQVFLWEKGDGFLAKSDAARIQGQIAWGRQGVAVRQMSKLPPTLNSGSPWDMNCATLVPKDPAYLSAIWCFCSSDEYRADVREIDQSLKVTNATLVKIAFDLERWKKVADEQYPNGLPAPYTDDLTQWIFHGHPCSSVTWDEQKKRTAKSEPRIDDTVLQVAVARLLGYRWPAELDPEMELAIEQREWVEESKKLLSFADDDGIVCLPAVRGEKSADQRLEELLQAAYGDVWSTQTRNQLLDSVGCKNKSLDVWLHEKFFEQHCKLFQHRPFIWHIWDGLKDGFSALVNYHQLDKKNLERLIYTYLDDWIRTQSHQQADGVDGAAERLAAANNLKERLELILEGEAPYDIFVRWKPIEEQSIGWSPDLNDGVRLNIRPFLNVPDVGKKDAGILRAKPNIHWKKDRGKDVESAPWFKLGLEYGGKEGDRINDHHLSLADKQNAKD
jgi:hypothetical protein